MTPVTKIPDSRYDAQAEEPSSRSVVRLITRE
jgi:hypothetical protein